MSVLAEAYLRHLKGCRRRVGIGIGGIGIGGIGGIGGSKHFSTCLTQKILRAQTYERVERESLWEERDRK